MTWPTSSPGSHTPTSTDPRWTPRAEAKKSHRLAIISLTLGTVVGLAGVAVAVYYGNQNPTVDISSTSMADLKDTIDAFRTDNPGDADPDSQPSQGSGTEETPATETYDLPGSCDEVGIDLESGVVDWVENMSNPDFSYTVCVSSEGDTWNGSLHPGPGAVRADTAENATVDGPDKCKEVAAANGRNGWEYSDTSGPDYDTMCIETNAYLIRLDYGGEIVDADAVNLQVDMTVYNLTV